MIAVLAVGCSVIHERRRTAAIKEVDRDSTLATAISRLKLAVEVLQKVDLLAIVGAWCEDTRNSVHGTGRVVADDDRVDELVEK